MARVLLYGSVPALTGLGALVSLIIPMVLGPVRFGTYSLVEALLRYGIASDMGLSLLADRRMPALGKVVLPEQANHPAGPTGYFDPAGLHAAEAFRERAERHRDAGLIPQFPFDDIVRTLDQGWLLAVAGLVRRWLIETAWAAARRAHESPGRPQLLSAARRRGRGVRKARSTCSRRRS